MGDKTVDVRGIPIGVHEFGSGRAIIGIHGLSLDHQVMRHALEPLLAGRTGWRRIYFDLPGHGETPAPDWLVSSDQLVEILAELIGQIVGEETFALVGQSYGAYLAHGLASRIPQRVDGLMMIVPVVVADRERRDVGEPIALVRDPDALADLRADEEFWPMLSTVQTSEMLAAFRQPEGVLPPDEAFLERLEPHYSLSTEGSPVTVPAPALVLAGRQDAIVGYRDALTLLETLPRGTFAILDRAAHVLEHEQRELFGALAGEWLARVEEWQPR